ncbi:hypothetical protein QUG02_11430 [Bacillus hominis]|uniref:Proteinase inhibitor n=1 Tax=Bacillus hominis TaxID=2817478 RepID=A0ABT7R730_9BACI|nr:hypothetical protein [Bacillus hominis]MDM5433313.1 hypothetical protein [Bacillus hominis]MDM5438729.1 hypothetical protein [Bacillus hominis]
MKKLLVIPVIAASLIGLGQTSTFAATEEINVIPKITEPRKTQLPPIQYALEANEEHTFHGSGIFKFYHEGGKDLRVFIKNIGDETFSYDLYNSKGGWLSNGKLTPGQQTINEFSIEWSDWLPDGRYQIVFRNNSGAFSKVKIAARALDEKE